MEGERPLPPKTDSPSDRPPPWLTMARLPFRQRMRMDLLFLSNRKTLLGIAISLIGCGFLYFIEPRVVPGSAVLWLIAYYLASFSAASGIFCIFHGMAYCIYGSWRQMPQVWRTYVVLMLLLMWIAGVIRFTFRWLGRADLEGVTFFVFFAFAMVLVVLLILTAVKESRELRRWKRERFESKRD